MADLPGARLSLRTIYKKRKELVETQPRPGKLPQTILIVLMSLLCAIFKNRVQSLYSF